MISNEDMASQEVGDTVPSPPTGEYSGLSSSSRDYMDNASMRSDAEVSGTDAATAGTNSPGTGEIVQPATDDAPDAADGSIVDEFSSALRELKECGAYNVTTVWAPKSSTTAWCLEAESEEQALTKARNQMSSNKTWQAADVCVKRTGTGSFRVLVGTTILRGKSQTRFVTLQVRHQQANGRSRAMAVVAKEDDLSRTNRVVEHTQVELVTLETIKLTDTKDGLINDEGTRSFMQHCLAKFVEDPAAFSKPPLQSQTEEQPKKTADTSRSNRKQDKAAAKATQAPAAKKTAAKKSAAQRASKSNKDIEKEIDEELKDLDESNDEPSVEEVEQESPPRPKRDREQATPSATEENDDGSVREAKRPKREQSGADGQQPNTTHPGRHGTSPPMQNMDPRHNSHPGTVSVTGLERGAGSSQNRGFDSHPQQGPYAPGDIFFNPQTNYHSGYPIPRQIWAAEQQRRALIEREILQEMEWERQREKHRERIELLLKLRDTPQYPFGPYL
jgi:hypothetical protein